MPKHMQKSTKRTKEKPNPDMIYCKCQKCGATWRQYKNRPKICKVCNSTDIFVRNYPQK